MTDQQNPSNPNPNSEFTPSKYRKEINNFFQTYSQSHSSNADTSTSNQFNNINSNLGKRKASSTPLTGLPSSTDSTIQSRNMTWRNTGNNNPPPATNSNAEPPVDPHPSSSGSSSNWGRGGSHAPRGRGSGRGGRGARGGKKAISTVATEAHANLPSPSNTMENLQRDFDHIIKSDRFKPGYSANPKSVLTNHISALVKAGWTVSGAYELESGYVDGERQVVKRASITVSVDPPIVAYGDGKSKVDAEKAAAFHAICLLLEHGILGGGKGKGAKNIKPNPAAAIPSSSSAPIASTSNLNSNQPSTSTNTSTEISTNLSDGSVLTVPRAREFMDFYCNKFKFGKPDISLTGHSSKKEKSNGKNKKVRLVSENGWKATMTVGGSRIGFADAKSKKEATQNVYLDTVKYLEQSDPDLFKLFLSQVKSGKALGTVPHVYFNLSNDLEDDVRLIYQDIKESLLFAKRPRPAGVIQSGEANDESKSIPTGPKKKKSRWDSHVNPNNNGEVAMKRKSEELLDKLQNFQIDPRVSKMREQRRSLPVSQRSADLLVKIELNSVIIVMAATGSGKTTQVPQILFDDYITKEEGSKCNVVCTQPRRIAAISVAERIARERGESLGDTIGYQVRFDAKLPKKNGSITFCTTGIFLRRLQSSLSADDGDGDDSNDYLDSLTHVVIDEVHERDVETDLLLVVIKKLLEDRKRKGKKEIKLILMSATIDPTLFQNYFASESTNNSSVKKLAPVVEIPGRSFPVEKHFLEETFKDIASLRLTPKDGQWVFDQENVQKYLERELNQGGGLVNASDQVNQNSATEGSVIDDLELPYPLISLMIAFVLTKSADGHVLVFLPGLDEIKAIANILADTQQCPLLGLNFNDKSQFEIHFLHSSIPIQDQQLVFEDPPPGVRRIILSTNIAETSITIPNVVYVVDTGRVKEKRFDPERHLSSLVSAWVGTSNLNQRAGRAGRHRPGEYYGVLSKARYEKLSVHQTVEMMRVDLSNVVMHIKALDIPGMEVEEVLDSAIEPPSSERVKAAMEKLRLVGALDSNKSLTSLGHVLLQLPVDVPIGKMCLYGAFFKSLDPVLSLAAILTARDPFMAPLHLKKEADAVKDSWSPTDFRSDPLCILRAFNKWNEYQKKGEYHLANRFCGDNFLSKITLAGILQVKEHLFQSMEKAGIIDLVMGQENDRNRMNGNDLGFGGGRGYRRERLSETHPELNRNSGSTPLLAALIAVSSVPNFAIKAGKESFRTSQDKTCFIHPSSVCHSKHTKNKPTESQTGEKELFAFSEKVRNTSGQTSSNNSNPQTNLRGCTRLDPLTYMLFGTVNVSTTHNGIECDGWLPMVGNLDALDSVESLKKAMDACMLRVFEGIGKTSRNKGRNANFSGRNGNQSQITNGSQNGFENSENLRDDLSLSPQEIEEFHSLTSDIVEVLDAYAKSRSGDGSNANSRASTRPATPNSGYYPSSNSNQGFSNSAPQSTYGGGGGSHVASNNSSSAYLPPNFGRQGGGFNSGPPSSAGGRSGYSSPYGGGPAIPLSMNYHQGSSGLNPNSIQSGSSGWGSNSAYGTTNSMPTSSSETPSSMSHNWRSGGK